MRQIKTIRALGVLGALAGLASTSLIGGSPVLEAAPLVNPVTRLAFTEENPVGVDVASGGGAVIASAVSGDSQHLVVETGATTDWTNPPESNTRIAAGNSYAAGSLDETTLIRRTLSSGAIETFSVQFPADSAGGTTSDWTLSDRLLVDDNGRYFAFAAGNGNLGASRVFVYDTSAGQLLASAPDGLLESKNNSSLVAIASDGSYVITAEFDAPGGVDGAYVRWDTATGGSRQVVTPTDIDVFAGAWKASYDLNWSLYPAAGNTLVRRDNRTGATATVPVGFDAVEAYDVYDGGRVVAIATAAGTTSDQLYTWNGETADLVALSVTGGGDLGNAPIEWFTANADATVITFTSFADDLAPGGIDSSRNVYQVTLPTLRTTGELGGSRTLCAAAQGGVAGDWVTVNVTPLRAQGGGFGTVHSSDDLAGGTSNVNFEVGTVDPNVAFAQVGADGQFCFTNSVDGPVHLIMDQLTVSPAATFSAPTASGAVRVVDTRGGAMLAAGEKRCVAAQGGVAGDWVTVNVTPLRAQGGGFGTVHSSDDLAGGTSNVNFEVGTVDPNVAFAQVGADGQFCFTNSVDGPVHLIMDQLTVSPAATFSAPTASGAVRVVDTRGGAMLAAGEKRCVAAQGGVAGDWVTVNVTPLRAQGGGFGTVHSSDDLAGGTSNVNFEVGTVDPNVAFAQVGADGQFCFTNSVDGPVHLIMDQLTVSPAATFSAPTASGAVRVVDTRG